jgi:hypothetical protein
MNETPHGLNSCANPAIMTSTTKTEDMVIPLGALWT